jgi:two-component system sensor histidine kinase GlrK
VTFPRPRSLSGLILLGLLLVSLPLLGGVVSAALEMTRLSESSRRLVVYGVQATRYSQALVRQVAAMERTARLYQLLGRAELKAVFDENHRRMAAVLDGVTALPGNDTRDQVVGDIRRRADLIATGLDSGAPARQSAALREFGPLSRDTGQLSLLASRQIDEELQRVQQETDQVRRRLLWQTMALVPITLGLALAFALFLGRPIRDIDRAIANLGHGRLGEPVRVRGPPTDLEALGRQIEWLRQRLLEVSEERERFLRHVSHELKTPLANIREGSELLLEGTVGPLRGEQREIASILRENSLRLQHLIENLLSYSEWQSSRSELDLTDFRLVPLVNSVVESYQLPITSRRLRLETNIEDLALRADRAKLRLVIDNLLSNAVKFAPEDGTIRIDARRHGEEMVLDVADSGPGVPPEERERIFEPFFQGATPQGGLVRGTGIGLSVVQEFVLAHGGRVELVEGALPGAHFRVRLPLAVGAAVAPTEGIQ